MNKKQILLKVLSSTMVLSLLLSGAGTYANNSSDIKNNQTNVKSIGKKKDAVEEKVEYDLEKLVTLFDPAYAIENFKSIESILPKHDIQAPKKATKMKYKLENLDKVTYTFDGKKYTLNDYLDKTVATGLLVIKDGKIVNERYLNGYNDKSKITSWSMAKSVVSTLIGIAIDEGKIKNVNDKVTKYVPELKGSGYENVTIKQVLQMSSGINFNEDYLDPESDINVLPVILYFEGMSVHDFAASLTSTGNIGKFQYKSIDTQILAMVLQKATGKSPSKYLEEKVWQPLGMESNAYWNTDMNDNEIGFAFINATLRDYGKFGLMMLNDGKVKNKQIVSKKWVQEATKPDSKALQPGVADKDFGYQYQWWTPKNADKGEFFAMGIWGQYIYVNQKEDIVIVKTSADPEYFQNDAENIAAFRAIVKKLK